MIKIYTYEEILERMMARVPNDLDKRPGSIMYDTLSLEAIELAQHYAQLPELVNLLYPDTAIDDWLDRSCEQYGGIKRRQATQAIREGSFLNRDGALMDVPLGSRFRINDITIEVTEKITLGHFKMLVEEFGSIGNLYNGNMIPISNIDNLGQAILENVVLINGQDREDDKTYRERFFYLNQRPAFGGNVPDYEIETLNIDGVGAVVVFPVWDGDGTVKLIIGDTEHNQASTELVNIVQNKFMPLNEAQLGTGLAPVGHTVTVATSTDLSIAVEADIKVEQGYTLADLKPSIENAIKDYINNVDFKEGLVYVARVTSTILNVPRVVDVASIKLNGTLTNIALDKTALSFQTPKAGTIALHEVS